MASTKVKPRPASRFELGTVRNLQKMLAVTLSFFDGNGSRNRKEYEDFKAAFKQYIPLPYSGPIAKKIAEIDKSLATFDSAVAQRPKATKDISSIASKMKASFLRGDYKKVLSMKAEAERAVNALKDAAKDSRRRVSNHRNPFQIDDPMFFLSSDFLRVFSKADMYALIDKDLSKTRYTYLKLPSEKLKDFQYIVHFANELQPSDSPIEISGDKFVKWQDYFYSDVKGFEDLKKMVDEYLHSNNQSLIPKIMDKMEGFPELVEANERLKMATRTLYRGIGGNDRTPPSERDIEKETKRAKFVATSRQSGVAERFAEGRGHVMGGRTHEWGVIITYSVKPKGIVLDTNVFGGLYGEAEVLVLPSALKAIDYEWLDEIER